MYHPSGLLTINLSAIQSNWLRQQQVLTAGTECSAVVKADAYGLGMLPVARALHQVGCRSFFVVSVAEGRALRGALGVEPNIYLLQGVPAGSESVCVADKLIPVLITHTMAQRWLEFCEAGSLTHGQRRCAIKINSGMNRLGLDPNELQSLLAQPDYLARLGCELVISHLACADQVDSAISDAQFKNFTQVLQQMRQQLPGLRASLANSAAVHQGHRWHFDLVRPGISLYGGNPTGLPQHQMQPVVTLQLPVLQSRHLAAGAAIGYGASYISDCERQVIAVGGGYGDGLFRSLSNKGHVWFRQPLPIVGRVSMDSMVVDVTALPESERPAEGDMVEFLGDHQDIDTVASAAGTIGYEILTRLTGRYERRYVLNDKIVDH